VSTIAHEPLRFHGAIARAFVLLGRIVNRSGRPVSASHSEKCAGDICRLPSHPQQEIWRRPQHCNTRSIRSFDSPTMSPPPLHRSAFPRPGIRGIQRFAKCLRARCVFHRQIPIAADYSFHDIVSTCRPKPSSKNGGNALEMPARETGASLHKRGPPRMSPRGRCNKHKHKPV